MTILPACVLAGVRLNTAGTILVPASQWPLRRTNSGATLHQRECHAFGGLSPTAKTVATK
jgi:hypothetical protein